MVVLSGQAAELDKRVTKLERKDAEAEVDALIAGGRIAQEHWPVTGQARQAYIELALTNRAMLDALLVPAPQA